MGQLVGLVVEYLVLGSVSAIWVLLFLLAYGQIIGNVEVWVALLFVPALYVLGMLSDYLGLLVLKPQKQKIEKEILAEYGYSTKTFSTGRLHAHLVAHCPELAKEMAARSSRDRVARGTLINIPIIGLSAILLILKIGVANNLVLLLVTIIIFTLVLLLIVFFMWRRFQKYAVKYEMHTKTVLDKILDKKNIPFSEVNNDSINLKTSQGSTGTKQ